MPAVRSADGARTWDVPGPGGPTRVTSPAPRAIWGEILDADPLAGPTHLPGWLDCVCRADGWTDSSRLYEMPNGRRLVLPLVRRGLVVPGSGLLTEHASLPRGWGSGGVVAPGGATTEDVASVLTDLAATTGLRTLLRPGFATAVGWCDAWSKRGAVRLRGDTTPLETYILDLGGGFEEVWSQRFTSKARTGIRNARRKADKAGMEIEVGNSPQLIADFYDLYLGWLDRRAAARGIPRAAARWRGRRVEPLVRFRTVAGALGDQSRLWVARLDGVPVAAAFAIFHGAVGIGWRAYSDRDLAGPLRAHELVQIHAIEYACEIGCRYFDMGESGGVAALAHVKNRFGAMPHQVTEYAFERLPISSLDRGFREVRGHVESRVLALRDRHRGRPS